MFLWHHYQHLVPLTSVLLLPKCRLLTSPPAYHLLGNLSTYDQILLATGYFSKSNFIKHGGLGDLLYGGLQIVIKKVDLSVSMYLITELEFFGKVSHARFVHLPGHCFENGNNKFLV